MEKVFVDTDIIFDLLAKRDPFYKYAAQLFSIADKGVNLKLYISSLTFANIHYLLSKKFKSSEVRKILIQFKTLVSTLSVDDKIVNLALSSPFKDFEDAIQYYCAIENGIEVILTRNLKDFKSSELPVLTAKSYLNA